MIRKLAIIVFLLAVSLSAASATTNGSNVTWEYTGSPYTSCTGNDLCGGVRELGLWFTVNQDLNNLPNYPFGSGVKEFTNANTVGGNHWTVDPEESVNGVNTLWSGTGNPPAGSTWTAVVQVNSSANGGLGAFQWQYGWTFQFNDTAGDYVFSTLNGGPQNGGPSSTNDYVSNSQGWAETSNDGMGIAGTWVDPHYGLEAHLAAGAPEMSTWLMLLAGAGALAIRRRAGTLAAAPKGRRGVERRALINATHDRDTSTTYGHRSCCRWL